MIFIYGDSHGNFSFKNLVLDNINKSQYSITMHRIARDNKIINFDNNEHNKNSIIILVYGEIDCRCQIMKQVYLDRHEDEVINLLVNSYFETIKNNILLYKKIIIVGVIPPTSMNDFNNENRKHPFVGSDEDRIRITNKLNKLIEEYCKKFDYCYFYPYDFYKNDYGCLKHELSDSSVHLGNNTYFLEEFIKLYNSFNV